jgi:hypothetical protein
VTASDEQNLMLDFGGVDMISHFLKDAAYE